MRSAPTLADDIEEAERQLGGSTRRAVDAPVAASEDEEASVNPTTTSSSRRSCSRIGAAGVLIRRNAIVVFMCVELMLNASQPGVRHLRPQHGNLDGQVVAFFVMVVAAAEVVVGLAIIVTIFRTRRSASVDDPNLLKL